MYHQALWQVLIVDDARFLRGLVKDALCAGFPGIGVIEAQNVAEGYHHVREYRPALVLLDVSLPDGNGLHLARRIRDELPEVVVCICTSHDNPEYRQAAADSGAAWFISKNDSLLSDTESLVGKILQGACSGRYVPRRQGEDPMPWRARRHVDKREGINWPIQGGESRRKALG